MGQVQFMPSSFLQYAVDQDGDGKKDLWGNLADVFGSAANYLSQNGWREDQTWGRRVRVPEALDPALLGLEIRKPLSAWQALGVRQLDGSPLPAVDMQASLIRPTIFTGEATLPMTITGYCVTGIAPLFRGGRRYPGRSYREIALPVLLSRRTGGGDMPVSFYPLSASLYPRTLPFRRD